MHASRHESCPNCGRSKITVDSDYGSDLKRSAFLKRASKSLLIWLGVFTWMLLDAFPGDRLGLMTYFVLALLGLAWTVVLVVRAYRHTYRGGRYPDARYTCRLCKHSWTSNEPSGTVEDEINVPGAASEDALQDVEEALPAETPVDARRGWKFVAVSFGLALLINALVILIVDTTSYGGQLLSGSYLGVCLPAAVALPALGGGMGALLARGYGSRPWRGAVAGIWMGAIAAIAIWFWGLFGIGPGV